MLPRSGAVMNMTTSITEKYRNNFTEFGGNLQSRTIMRSWKEISPVLIGLVVISYMVLYLSQSYQKRAVAIIGSEVILSNVTVPVSTRLTRGLVSPTKSLSAVSRSFYTPWPSLVASPTTYPRTSTQKPRSLPIQPSAACNVLLTERKPEEGRWYNFTTTTMVFFAYTAFVDDRPSLQTDPVVRLIAVADKIEDMASKPNIFCRFHYLVDSKAELVYLETRESKSNFTGKKLNTVTIDVEMESNTTRPIGMGWNLNSKLAREYIFTCPVPSLSQLREKGKTNASILKILKSDLKIPLPTSVGIFIEGVNQTDVASCMPVEKPSKPKIKQDFVLCVQVAFGQIDPMRLIEWLELQSLLGVQLIGIYDQEIHEPAMFVLRHYAEKGLVDLRRSDYIPDGPEQYLLHGSPVINDCMFRNLHAYKYMMVYDIDEVILPKLAKLESSSGTPFGLLIDNLEKKYGKEPSQYLFRNSYFFFDIPPDTKEPKELVFLRHRKTAPISSYGYSSKSIIDQRTCIQMHNHYCWGATKQYEKVTHIDVDVSLGKNHHYKKCHLSSAECKSMIAGATHDDTILIYKSELLKKVKTSVNEIRTKLKQTGVVDFLSSYFTTT